MNEENGTCTPLIFSGNGGMSIETRKLFQRLSELISEKHHFFTEFFVYSELQ